MPPAPRPVRHHRMLRTPECGEHGGNGDLGDRAVNRRCKAGVLHRHPRSELVVATA
jgi:hypothetical protein